MMQFLSDYESLVLLWFGVGLIALAVCIQNGVASAAMFVGIVSCSCAATVAVRNWWARMPEE